MTSDSRELDAIAEFKLKRRPFPLASFLRIYSASETACYMNYMEGADSLAAYLEPISIPKPTVTVPRIHRSYELYELAKLLVKHAAEPVTYQQVEDSIYEYYKTTRS